jgi:hypothetical protein
VREAICGSYGRKQGRPLTPFARGSTLPKMIHWILEGPVARCCYRSIAPLASLTLFACSYQTVALREVNVERMGPGNLAIRFEAQEDLLDHGPQIQGYLRVTGGRNPSAPGKGGGWSCSGGIERAPASKSSGSIFEYLFVFPERSEREGLFPLRGPDEKVRNVSVEAPYNLLEAGDYTLEFWVMGNVPDGFPNVVKSPPILIPLRVPR